MEGRKEHQPETDRDAGLDLKAEAATGPNGFMVMPAALVLRGIERIRDMLPNTWEFVNITSLVCDVNTYELMLDSKDKLPKEAMTISAFRSRPAVMRVYRKVGESILDTFIADYRHVEEPFVANRGLEDGTYNFRYQEANEQYDIRSVSAATFSVFGEVVYSGLPATINELKSDMTYLMGQVDERKMQMERFSNDVPSVTINSKTP